MPAMCLDVGVVDSMVVLQSCKQASSTCYQDQGCCVHNTQHPKGSKAADPLGVSFTLLHCCAACQVRAIAQGAQGALPS